MVWCLLYHILYQAGPKSRFNATARVLHVGNKRGSTARDTLSRHETVTAKAKTNDKYVSGVNASQASEPGTSGAKHRGVSLQNAEAWSFIREIVCAQTYTRQLA